MNALAFLSPRLILGIVIAVATSAAILWFSHLRYQAGVAFGTAAVTVKWGADKKAWADQEAIRVSTAVSAYQSSLIESARRETALQKALDDDQKFQAAQRVAYARLQSSHVELQHSADALATAARAVGGACASNPTAADPGTSASGDSGLDVLANVLGMVDHAAGELAEIADQRGEAGHVCEQYAAALITPAAPAASAP